MQACMCACMHDCLHIYPFKGESNAGNGKGYECLFPAMIHDWRAKFSAPLLPFLFVVLAPCAGHKWCANFVNVRNAQVYPPNIA